MQEPGIRKDRRAVRSVRGRAVRRASLAGTLFGISNTLANMNGFIAPQLAGYLIRDQEQVFLPFGDSL